MSEKFKRPTEERKQLKNVIEEFNLGVLFHSAKKSILWVILFFIISVSISFFYLRHTPKTYQSSATLIRKVTKQTKILGIEDLLSEDKTEIDLEIQLLKSKYLISQALDTLPLRIEYATKGRLSSTKLYKNQPFEAIFEDYTEQIKEVDFLVKFQDEKNYTLSFELNDVKQEFTGSIDKTIVTPFFNLRLIKNDKFDLNQIFVVKIRDYSKVIDELTDNIIITPINYNTNTIEITVKSENPIKSFEIANQLSKYFIEFDKVKKGESISKIITFLDEQIENFGKQYDETNDSLKAFRIESGFLDPSLQIQQKLKEIKELEKQKDELDVSLSSFLWFQNFIESDKELSAIAGLSINDQSQSFQKSIERIIELQNERNTKLLNVTPDHPSILLLNNEINLLKTNLTSQLDMRISGLKEQKNKLSSQINSFYQNLYSLPDKESDFTEIKRDNDLKKQFYLNLVEKRNMYLISKAGIVSDYIILKQANVVKSPVAPNVLVIRLSGVVIGLLLGIILIALRYLLHFKISNLSEIETNSNANILGIVPKHKEKLDRSAIVVTNSPKSTIAESFRAIRSNLEFLDNSKESKVIATTSTVPGEGKTFVGINLAAIFSLLDKKVVIVDFDLRKPRIAKIFDLDNQRGVSTVLIGRSTIEECTYQTEYQNIDVIPSGPVPPNPAELVSKEECTQFINHLKANYDYVFLDTPPIGLVTDALELLKQANYPIYVLRADFSQRSYLENVNKLIFDNQIYNLSVVLNDFGRGASASYGKYGYGYSYGYGYGYANNMGYYSDETNEEESWIRKLLNKIFAK